ncbi:TetR/AcrR family transcriptional regulator [Lacticaseibacillus saniviri]|uniref:TetR/AcrR family transcriptional regulator n=1 Tax=Lacticaseibacillus saniviri TaxID=931533 RepID=UPI000B29D140|nr:TetR/AcrR family transcriptional regulator [Lacticaseibacillus saniviri]MCG4281796.1 TetR/AcrR family transcriptional regulator [Lacticaseibacillus saniviri]
MGKHRTLDRDKVLVAAREIVRTSGFRSLTFQSLAKALDIRSQSLYNYYRNLDDVIESLGTELMDRLYQELIEQLPGVSGRQALSIYAKTAHDYFDQEGPLVEVIYYVHNYPETSPFVKATGRVLDILRRLVRDIPLKHMDHGAYVQAFISSVLGFTVLEIMGFLPEEQPGRSNSFQELLDLHLGEIQATS